MPSQTELVAELAERWERDDRAAVEELVHPEIEIDMEFAEPIAQRYRFEDGRVIRMTMLTDVERAIADFEAGRPAHPPDE